MIITDDFSGPAGQTTEYIWDGPTKNWCDIANLGLTDVVPFSTKYQTGLSAALACEVADYFGADIPPATVELNKMFRRSITNDLTEGDVSDAHRGTYF